MRAFGTRLLLAVVALASSTAVAARALEHERFVAARYDCSNCHDQGLVACKKCAKSACPGKSEALFCTAALACEACGGTRLEDCPKCSHAPAVDLAKRRAQIAAWRETVAPADQLLERALLHAESKHFVLTWDIRKLDVKGIDTPHAALHLFLDYLENLQAHFESDLPAQESDFLAKTRVMLWGTEDAQEKASSKFTLQPSNTESKLMGAKPVVSIFYDKSHLHEPEELHQAVVHQVVHCLLSNVFDGIWPGNLKGGWLDEGLAHYYENSLFGEVRHYCFVESDSIQYFKFGRWEPAVLTAVDRGDALGFLSVANVDTVEMTPEQRMFGWSYCDFLMRSKPGKVAALVKAVKQKKPLAESLQQTLGLTAFQLEDEWKAWVRANYSLKPKK